MTTRAEGATLRLAMVGLGRGAVLTAPGLLAHERIRVVAGCDPSPEAREAFTRATGAVAFDDLARLLANPTIDAVYVASPHEHHALQVVAAARAGKHILVEKPMAVDLAGANAMIDAAARAGVVLMVGPSHGYDPPVALAASLAERKGGARLIHAFKYSDFLYRPRRPAELDRAQGGGVVFSQASHQIDIIRRIAAAPIASVRGWVGDWDERRPADGAYTAIMTFANGAAGSIAYSGYARYDSDALAGWIGEMGAAKPEGTHAHTRRALAAADENSAKRARGFAAGLAAAAPHHESFGHILVCCRDADLELTPDGVNVHDDDGRAFHPAPLPSAPRLQVADALVRAVLGRERPQFDGAWGRMTLGCCHAIIASAEAGRDIAPADLIEDKA